MKRLIITTVAAVFLSGASVNSVLYAEAFKSPGLNGSTGLITTPTAHTGWEGKNLGMDTGMHYIGADGGYYIPKITMQILGKLEIGGAFDMQPGADNDDLLLHTKFHFNASGTDLAIGGNAQMIEKGPNNSVKNYQIYLAATYAGNFFNMPAETTLVFGKSFGDYTDNSNLDFSMGFDLDFLPNLFQHYVHWINDFSNYSYSMDAGGANAGSRGAFNTGIRLALLRDGRFKLNFDALMLDALDDNRCFGAGMAFGMAF